MIIRKIGYNIVTLLAAQIILYLLIILFFLPTFSGMQTAAEEEECEDTEVKLIARNSDGDFIPGINVEIYRQTIDVDGKPKPGGKVTSGKIDSILGYFGYIFRNDEEDRGMHAIHMWHKNKTVGDFWFYNDLYVGCGESIYQEEYLSAINVILRDTAGNLRKNTSFSIYTQRYDVDDNPIKEKQDLVAKLDTSTEGEAKVYVADSSQSLTGEAGDHYVLEMPGANGGVYTLYDIEVGEGTTNEIEYIISDMKLILKDEKETPFPANTKIEIYKQEYDVDDEPIIGSHLKDIYTDDKGMAVFEYPTGLYAVRIMGADNQYEYFYELEIIDQTREIYELILGRPWQPGAGACAAASNINVITRDLDGDVIAGLNFEFYTIGQDVNGRPVAKTKLGGGEVNEHGEGIITVHPDPLQKYALKIYGVNASVGDYWFFDNWQFVCGEDKNIERRLPALHLCLRDGYGNLLKNHKFTLHTQKFDIDGYPIREKKDLISSAFTTNETGEAVIFISPDHPYDWSKRGTYVLTTLGKSKDEYVEYDIPVGWGTDTYLEYQLSDVVFELKNSAEKVLADETLELYTQSRNEAGYLDLGKRVVYGQTDDYGIVRFEYPAGYYAAVVKDDFGQKNIFWQQRIANRQRSYLTVVPNVTRIKVIDGEGLAKPAGTVITAYALVQDENGQYYQEDKLKTFKIAASGYAEVSLASKPYLFTVKSDKTEYGRALYTENNKLQNLTINLQPANIVTAGQRYTLQQPSSAQGLAERLKGYILLQVEERGEAWYVDYITKRRYYLRDGAVAYEMLRRFGIGITNEDLKKIPIGIDERFEEYDYDGDYVWDKMEEAIGTDMYDRDSDSDGYDDGTEVSHDYDPLGSGRLPIDVSFTGQQKGKILLQVESRGEAWYVNPQDGRRYYMKDGDSAYEIMRFLSLGITNENLEMIETGKMEN